MAVVIVSISTCHFVLIHDYSSTIEFQRKATEYLGTDNFTVTSWDGFLIAQTINGTQYPTETEVDQYWYNQSMIRLQLVAIVVVIAIPLFFVGSVKSSSVLLSL